MRRNLPAARLGSFTKAASELGVAQPAITRHVANLETWLDAKLFDRTGNVIRLTRLGHEAAQLATSVLDRLELGLSQIVSQRDNDLVIGASFGITHLCIMPRLAAIRAATSTTVNFVTSGEWIEVTLSFTPTVDINVISIAPTPTAGSTSALVLNRC